ncbi:hypothetical protein ACFV0L_29350 [Streptosporangium canum]|uniref:hypothetical protein n=1 Tax=Streptosporangium canum TaxID=324952 RepID=UPI0036BF29BA
MLGLPSSIGMLGVAGAGAFAALGVGAAGLGLGILGIGVAAAATTKEVKSAFTDLATDTKAMIVEASAPLVPVLTGIATEARTLLAPLGGALTSAFTGLAPALSSLASSAISGLHPLIGAIVPISEAASPLIIALGSGLQPVLAALASTLIMVSQSAAMFAPELEQMFAYVGQLVMALGPLLSSLIQLGAPIIGPLLALLVGLAGQLSIRLSPVLQRLGPILGDVLTRLYPLVGAFGGLLSAVLPILPPVAELIGFLVSGLMPVLVPLVPVIAAAVAISKAWTIAQAALNLVMAANPIGLAVIAVGALVAAFTLAWNSSETLRDTVTGAFEGVSRGAEAMWRSVSGWWTNLIADIQRIPGQIDAAARGMWDGFADGFKATMNWIIRGWNSLSFSIPAVDIPYVGRFGGMTIGVPNIPYLAKGGNITAAGAAIVGERGPELLSLPRGAQVSPLSRGGGSGTTIHVNVTGAIDPIATARELEKVLRKYSRETGRTALSF